MKHVIYSLLISVILSFTINVFAQNQSNTVNLKQGTKFIVKKGATLIYSFKQWYSVGFMAKFKISNKNVVKFEEKIIKPQNRNHRRPGGDRAKATFVFKAINTGKTTITFNEIYRGNITKIHKVVIIVADDSY